MVKRRGTLSLRMGTDGGGIIWRRQGRIISDEEEHVPPEGELGAGAAGCIDCRQEATRRIEEGMCCGQ